MEFRYVLRYMREREGLTQAQLADRAKVRQSAICQYELGLKKPSAESHAKLAKALGVTMDDLMFGERNKKEDKQ